jgi:hypothetical protein
VNWDSCDYRIKEMAIKCGRLLFPDEKNITKVYEETCKLLKVPVMRTVVQAKKLDGTPYNIKAVETHINVPDHLPAPHEMEDTTGHPLVPRRDCPECKEKDALALSPLCLSCKDAEGGKYRSVWFCTKCQYKERSEKAFVKWLDELGVDFTNQSKKAMGVQTMTDEGLK